MNISIGLFNYREEQHLFMRVEEALWSEKLFHHKSFNNLLIFLFQNSELRKTRYFKIFHIISVSAQGLSSLLPSCLRHFLSLLWFR